MGQTDGRTDTLANALLVTLVQQVPVFRKFRNDMACDMSVVRQSHWWSGP